MITLSSSRGESSMVEKEWPQIRRKELQAEEAKKEALSNIQL